MRYLKTIIIIVLSFLFCACQKENLEVHEDTKFILFRSKLEVFSEPWTRGTPMEWYVSDFGVISYNSQPNQYHETEHIHVSYNELSHGWDYSPLLKWNHFSILNFLAYSPYINGSNGISLHGNDYSPTHIKYTVPETCANQPDLMVAVPERAFYDYPVEFMFHHALACVGFKVKGRFNEKITKIAIKGVSVSGMLNLFHTYGTPPQWSDIEEATDTEYTSGIKNDSVTVSNSLADAMDADGYLMMIPQKLGDDAKLIVTVDGVNKEVSLSGKEWKAGERYTYNINVVQDPIIIGNFGGWNGTEYTKKLQVDWELSKNDQLTKWATNETTTGATNAHYGPININTLKSLNSNLSNYAAAQYCEKKGDGWYLPSQNQLMAIWIAYEAVPSKFSFSIYGYWSATESSASRSWYISFPNGSADTYPKSYPNRVRCVRDVMP